MGSPWVLVTIFHVAQLFAFIHVAIRRFRRGNARHGWFFAAMAGLTVGLLVLDVLNLRLKAKLAETSPPTISNYGEYGVIHKPEAGCPAGFVERKDVFHRAGRGYPACVNRANPNGAIDYLVPEESVTVAPGQGLNVL